MSLIGKKFPVFTLTGHDGQTWTRDQLAGVWTVLYVYPKAMTSGCTRESQDFRDLASDFKRHGAQIVGLSPDDVVRQQKFVTKEGLTFPLLADPEHALLAKLNAWVEKSMYGKKYFGAERSTFLIDPTGLIVDEWRRVAVPDHVATVLKKLIELQELRSAT